MSIQDALRARQVIAHTNGYPLSVLPAVLLWCHPEFHGLSAGAMDCERDHLVHKAAALAGWQAIAVEDQPQLPAAAGEIGKPEPFRNVIVVELRVQPGRLG